MKRFSRKGLSLCNECPLRDGVRVWGEYPDGGGNLLMIGESPGDEERRQGKPFVGPAGRFLNSVLHEGEILRYKAHVTNLISCQPPSNRLDTDEGQEALRCCTPGFKAELALARKTVRLIMPLGTEPTHALGIEEGVKKARGSVYIVDGISQPILPTYHPSFILRGMKDEEGTWIGDFKKASSILKNGWKPPEEDFNMFPSIADVEAFACAARESTRPVAVDLETTGFRPYDGSVIVIGLALDGVTAMSVPFLRQFGAPYWKNSEKQHVLSLLQSIAEEKELLFQNGLGVDLPFLVAQGLEIRQVPHDVLLMHHVIHPELLHNLGYIVSVYGDTPYWKGEVLGREGRLLEMDDETVRRYNLRDSVVLHQVFDGLKSDLEEFGLWDIYNTISREMMLPVLEMQTTGALVSKPALQTFKRGLASMRGKRKKALYDVSGVLPSFNFASDEDLRLLIYGEVAPKFIRAQTAFAAYMENPKKRRDTKVFLEIEAKTQVMREVEPLYEPSAKVRRTDSGKASVKEEYLIARKISCLNRLKDIEGFKRKDASDERDKILRTVRFLDTLFLFNETDKLFSTYTNFPIWRDGRVHSQYKIHGTNTGRLASSSPNLQNQPEEARKVFVTAEGRKFVGRDFSNLEVWVYACVTHDEVLLSVLREGKNIHDETARDLFNVDKDHKLWKPYRAAAKKYRFAHIQYGGTLRSTYEKLMLEVPDLPITFGEFARADARYLKLHPAIEAYNRKQQKLCEADPRIVENAFGRRRILLGDDADVLREALNTPVQSTAADIVNKAMIRIYRKVRRLHYDAKFVFQIHDELVMDVAGKDAKKTDALMKREMEKEVLLWDVRVTIPTVGGIATCWADLK